jgi:fucose permease
MYVNTTGMMNLKMADNVYMDLMVGHKQKRSRMVHSEVLLGPFIVDAFVCVILLSPLRMDSLNI